MHFVDIIFKDECTDVVSCRLPDGSFIDVTCPLEVKLHNQNMGGVDLVNQMRKSYTCTRTSRSRWHIRLPGYFGFVHQKCIHS